MNRNATTKIYAATTRNLELKCDDKVMTVVAFEEIGGRIVVDGDDDVGVAPANVNLTGPGNSVPDMERDIVNDARDNDE